MIFVYAVWFRDSNMLPEDQGYEWPAVFEIDSADEQQAQKWGNFLATRFTERNLNEKFLRSEVFLPNDPMFADVRYPSPQISVSQSPDECDQIIGW